MTDVIPPRRQARDNRGMDPLPGSVWSSAAMVAGFAASAANPTLLRFAERVHRPGMRALDIGCGAGRNLLPLAAHGWHVTGLDLSKPMLDAAAARVLAAEQPCRVELALARMDDLPVADASMDLIIAHGIWNLARTGDEFRRAVREAARVARPGAGLFVFTFSRRTLAASAPPVEGETFVFTQFSGEPQCFLTAEQLVTELGAAGFEPDPSLPLAEHNVLRPGAVAIGAAPVIYEAAFRFTGMS
jgi:SAM-dependent methyltransferase